MQTLQSSLYLTTMLVGEQISDPGWTLLKCMMAKSQENSSVRVKLSVERCLADSSDTSSDFDLSSFSPKKWLARSNSTQRAKALMSQTSEMFKKQRLKVEERLSLPAAASKLVATGSESPRRAFESMVEKVQHFSKMISGSDSDDGIFESESQSSSTDQDGVELKLEEDPEFLEYQERAEIVAKYDQGTEGQDIDPWENPNYSLYHVTDRYGFIHGRAISPDREEELAKKKEIEREKKWRKMLNNWDKFYRTIKLRDRIRKGVPDKFRAELWKKILGVEELKFRNEGVYDQLKLRARLLAKDIKQIDMDINRTYRDHLFFRKRYDLKQQSLLHLLGAYSMYNTEVGYCQGMSQVAALMLMYMNEEDAFWALHILMCDRRHAMHGFFVPGFPKLLRYQTHYEKILSKYLSRLKKNMDKIQVPLIYTTKWWFGCFLDRVPFTLALRLWDMFISEGEPVMIAMSYNVLKMHQTMSYSTPGTPSHLRTKTQNQAVSEAEKRTRRAAFINTEGNDSRIYSVKTVISGSTENGPAGQFLQPAPIQIPVSYESSEGSSENLRSRSPKVMENGPKRDRP